MSQRMIGAVLLVLFALSAPLFAQQAAGPEEPGGIRRLTDLIDSRVHSRTGGIAGRVRDVVFSPQGTIASLVVRVAEIGEGLRVDDRDFVIPVQRVTAGFGERDLVILDLEPRDLLALPYLQNGRLPQPAAGAAGAGTAGPSILGRDLLGWSFIGSQGQGLGGVRDVVLNLAERRVAYLAMESGGFLGLGQRLHAIPLDRIISIDSRERQLIVAISREQMRDLPTFEASRWPGEAAAVRAAEEPGGVLR